jgi:hypothetical protein
MLMEIYRHAIAKRNPQLRSIDFEETAANSSDAQQQPTAMQINS